MVFTHHEGSTPSLGTNTKTVMSRERIYNIALSLVLIAMLLFVGYKGYSLLQNFLYAPKAEEEGHAEGTENLDLISLGKSLFDTQGCLACHSLNLAGGVLAPALDNVGLLRDEQWLKEKLIDPKKEVPGTFMPSFAYLSKMEIDALVAYMKSLGGELRTPEAVNLSPPERFTLEQVERGKELFQTQGCIACHTIGDQGGVIGPDLTREAQRKRTDEWQLQHLKDPLSVYVIGPTQNIAWPMPPYVHLPEEDLKALVAFLQSLK